MLQEKLKSLMCVDRSVRGDPKKDKLIDELNFKNCMCFKINTTSKFLLALHSKESLLFIQNILMPTISSPINFLRISNIDQT